MRTIHREIVSGLIISKDGKILLGKKDPSSGLYTDKWVLPGGGLNEGEEKLQGLARELYEETGLIIAIEHMKLVDDTMHGTEEKILRTNGEKVWCQMNFTIFLIHLPTCTDETRVTVGDDLIDYRWASKNELSTLPLPDPSIELFKKLQYFTAV